MVPKKISEKSFTLNGPNFILHKSRVFNDSFIPVISMYQGGNKLIIL